MTLDEETVRKNMRTLVHFIILPITHIGACLYIPIIYFTFRERVFTVRTTKYKQRKTKK